MTELQLAPATSVRAILGGVSDMTLWRWINDPTMNFPKPVVINRRRYWHQSEIAAWLEEKSQEVA